MTVTPLPASQPDIPLDAAAPPAQRGAGFADLLGAARSALDGAAAAEDAFARGTGDLTVMAVARAQADVAVAIAAAGTQRATQALSTLFGMQV